VDVDTVGAYTLTYTVSDAAGNQASLTRTVNIVAGQASTHTADLNASVALEMIWVDPGTFTMGSPTTEAGRQTDETQHEVTLTQGFYLGKYEVTQAQYEAVMTGNTYSLNATPSNWPNNPDRPVEKVSYDDIQKFLTLLNTQQAGNIPEGWAYVLPTEAQWEYACRAGTTTAYSWGNDINSSLANYAYEGVGTGLQQTSDVGQYSASPWGFFDMHGNVWEWTADAHASYVAGAQTDPFNDGATDSARVARGGSWTFIGTTLRSAYRLNLPPSNRYYHIGFRVGFQQQ
jgi:formylglycine-generating enzyme required for sulfatase activity